MVHFGCYFGWCCQNKLLEVVVYFLRYALVCHNAAQVFICHRDRTIYQITKYVRKIGVHTLYHQIPTDHTIVLEWHLMQYEITHSVNTENINKIICIDHITLGFTHLAVALKQPWMTKYLLRKWKIKCHQHDRPINRMETQYVFTDQMQICRPKLLIKILAIFQSVITI